MAQTTKTTSESAHLSNHTSAPAAETSPIAARRLELCKELVALGPPRMVDMLSAAITAQTIPMSRSEKDASRHTKEAVGKSDHSSLYRLYLAHDNVYRAAILAVNTQAAYNDEEDNNEKE